MLLSLLLFALSGIASSRSNSIQDVEHIVIFMQENRPYDHYYGTLRGQIFFSDLDLFIILVLSNFNLCYYYC